MRFGLKDLDLEYIIKVLEKLPDIEKAVIFGSRAKGNYKTGSDIDMAIYGERITFDTVAKLNSSLEEEGPLPYFVDIVDYTHSDNTELKEHVDRIGIIIYENKASYETET